MSSDEKLLAVENNVIDFLTTITWWTEIRFEKNNVYWAVRFSIFETLFVALAFMGELPATFKAGNYLSITLLGLLSLGALVMFLFKITTIETFTASLVRFYPQGCPNLGRISRRRSRERRLSVIFFSIFFVTWMITKDLFWFFFFTSEASGIFMKFLLACDSIPPQEKARRKLAKELTDIGLDPSLT